MRANRMRSSLRMSVKAKSSSRARPASKEGEIIGGSTVTQSLHLPPRPLRAPNNAEEEAKTSTSRYTLRPPIILFIQHNEFICLEGSQLMSRAKRGETFSRRFFSLLPSLVFSFGFGSFWCLQPPVGGGDFIQRKKSLEDASI
jgi:hypothetical protein